MNIFSSVLFHIYEIIGRGASYLSAEQEVLPLGRAFSLCRARGKSALHSTSGEVLPLQSISPPMESALSSGEGRANRETQSTLGP